MTSAEIEASARIVEAELRKIREATGMRDVTASSHSRDVYWYAATADGASACRDTLAECIASVTHQQRKAAT